jgi:hypothetical protein
MVMGIPVKRAIVHRQYFIYVVAVDKEPLEVVGTIIFTQDLPVVIVIVASGVVRVDEVFFLNSSAKGIVSEFSYIVPVLGNFDNAVLVFIFVPILTFAKLRN